MNKKGIEYLITLYSVVIGVSIAVIIGKVIENYFFYFGSNVWIPQFAILIFAIQPTQYISIKKFSNKN